MKLILLGAPGSGKGTLAQGLKEKYKIPTISTGDLLRQNIENKTEVGKTAKKYMNEGKLVPTEIVFEMLKERLNSSDTKNGYILDGFPRSIEQAEKLEGIAKIDKCLLLDVSKDVIIKRIAGRKTCKNCGKIYNISWYKSNTCECGGELYTRDDDNIETAQKRFDTYATQTEPLIKYYEDRGILVKIEGAESRDETLRRALEALK